MTLAEALEIILDLARDAMDEQDVDTAEAIKIVEKHRESLPAE